MTEPRLTFVCFAVFKIHYDVGQTLCPLPSKTLKDAAICGYQPNSAARKERRHHQMPDHLTAAVAHALGWPAFKVTQPAFD
jgi:hypothetical protein